MKALTRLARIAAVALTAALGSVAAQATDKITVTHWGVLMYGAPYAVAIEKGFYKEQGLNVDGVLTSKGGGTTMRNVMASDMPYGEVALSAVVAAMQQGIELKIVHTGVRTAGEILWATTPNSPIKSIKDLDGKKVAFTSPKSVTDMLLIMVAEKHGIKVDAVAAGGVGGGITMLQQNAVVAAPIMDPIWARMQDKLRPVFFVKDELPPMVQSVGVTTAEWAKANPDKLRKLIAARRKGVDFVYANPEETATIVAKMYEMDRAIALRAINNLRELKYWSHGEIEQEGMDNMVRGLEIIGEVKGKVDWSKSVDTSFLK